MENSKEFDDIIEMCSGLVELKKTGFASVKNDINRIIKSGKKDKKTLNLIECNLDYLIDFCYDDECEKYYNSVCDYIATIDEDSAKFYRDAMRNSLEEDIEDVETIDKKLIKDKK